MLYVHEATVPLEKDYSHMITSSDESFINVMTNNIVRENYGPFEHHEVLKLQSVYKNIHFRKERKNEKQKVRSRE